MCFCHVHFKGLQDVQLCLQLFNEVIFVGDVEKLFITANPRESSDIYNSITRSDHRCKKTFFYVFYSGHVF